MVDYLLDRYSSDEERYAVLVQLNAHGGNLLHICVLNTLSSMVDFVILKAFQSAGVRVDCHFLVTFTVTILMES